jgi:tetratricopeptide (TPR) repeat protein
MNSHSFLPFGDKQNHRNPFALNNTSVLQQQEANGTSKPALGDSYLRSRALTKAQQGNYIEAIALLSQLIHRHPHNAIDYNNRGLIYFQVAKPKKPFVIIIQRWN